MKTFERIAYEVVMDCYEDGVVLAELRYAPSFCSMGHGHDFGQVLSAIELGVDNAINEINAKGGEMAIGLICIAVGAMGKSEVDNTVNFLLDNRGSFVGFDMAGAEIGPAQFEEQFKRVHEAGIPITCHAAEDRQTGKPENAITAVDVLHATRIGHGIQIVQAPEVVSAIKASGAMLEVCISSNYLTSAVPSIRDHPARNLFDQGVKVSINTDDPGKSLLTTPAPC